MKSRNSLVVCIIIFLLSVGAMVPVVALADNNENITAVDAWVEPVASVDEDVLGEPLKFGIVEDVAFGIASVQSYVESSVESEPSLAATDPYLSNSGTDMVYVTPIVEEVLQEVEVEEPESEPLIEITIESVEPVGPKEEIVVSSKRSVIENEVTEEVIEETEAEDVYGMETDASYSWDGEVLTAYKGVNQGPSGKETYYNLDMSGVLSGLEKGSWIYAQCIDKTLIDDMWNKGGYWVRDDGCKMFGDYIMVAANLTVRPRGSLVPTSLGMGIVVDTGGFARNNPYQLDIAVDW